MLELIEEYFERFSSKMCCFDDLIPYLKSLTEDERSTLHAKMSLDDGAANSVSCASIHSNSQLSDCHLSISRQYLLKEL